VIFSDQAAITGSRRERLLSQAKEQELMARAGLGR